ncbi:uncharacterized protein LOC128361756 [Scomber japonicus]|uniref:uncharacterized protein LOC128361756 n=1 Tax=Scomber japonicus TaxID=13676 RepID=UPI002304E123|nr:uncharacterized protein LOC128361756 [Scomber japonicus]
MPRGKGYRRSQAARMRMASRQLDLELQPPCSTFVARGGTGYRHAVRDWPTSAFTGRSHKLVIPADAPDKKFVLIVGASHLRAIVDGFVEMPEGRMSFGFMSTPGASAAQLRTEVENAVLPRIPEAVCLLAPGNDLTASRTVDEAAVEFRRLLTAMCRRWPKLCVLDFPRRLTVEMDYQELLSQEYHRVAAQMGIPYKATAEHFPLGRRELWCRDGVHLSDSDGMPILSQLLWVASYQQVESSEPEPEPEVRARPSPPVPRRSPRVVVTGEVTVPPHSNPFEWNVVGPGRKMTPPANLDRPGAAKKRVVQQEGNVVLKECSVVLNPVWFSRELLDVLGDGTVHVPAPVSTAVAARQKKTTRERCRRPIASWKRVVQPEEAAALEAQASPTPVPACLATVAEREEVGAPPSDQSLGDTRKERAMDLQVEDVQQSCDAEGTAVERVHDVGVPASSTAASDVQDQVIHDPVMSFIRGSFNQGHKRFGPNRHKQCATNSVTAVMTNVVKSAWTWTQTDIDNVLLKGNDLYTYMKKHHMISDAHRSGYIFVRELPREHVLCNNTFRLEYLDTLTGDIDVEDYDPALQDVAMPLDVAFQRAMFQADACLLTIRKNMCVVFKQGSRFAVFDPHARGDDGGWQPDGSSIIAYYDSLDALYTHITKLVQSLYAYDAHARDKLFEVTGVKAVIVVPHSSTSDTAVHGTSAHVHDCDEVSGEGCSVDFEPETVTDSEQSEIVTVTDREQQSETLGEKYKSNPDYTQSIKKRNQEKKRNQKLQKHQIDFVIQQFREKVKQGPEYVCCVCHRLLFQHQVLQCRKEQYGKKGSVVASLADKCITSTYLHECGDKCTADCTLKWTHVGKLWICHTCHRKILSGKVPEESEINNLQLDPIPPELNTLNSLEQHLIAQHIPFMKVLALPKGGQNGVHGPVTCVPSNNNAVNNVLPRLENQDLMIRVKLKRKITYKGHYEYQYVHTNKVHCALEHLKSHNKWYKDVEINTDWTNPLEKDKNDDGNTSEEGEEVKDIEDEHINDKQQHGMYLDTCMQPVDVAQEILDQHFDSVLSVAPAEGNSPVRLLTDVSNEAKCFPVLFPKGTGTFHDARQHRLTLSRYLNCRVLNADGRFGSNLDYIFYAQYLSEINQVVSNVSIALRKGYHGGENTQITSSMLASTDFVKNVLKCDMGYKFLKPIRGTPVFWQSVQKDLFAMVRQLGIPTWFCSFSSADLRWTELMETFMKVQNLQGNVNEMDWSQKCNLLKKNPVTAARMFDHRFRSFLKDVIMSPAQPIGKIIDYFYRVEFQQRGSPHTHCLFWVENAPKIGSNTDQEVIDFIDKYVTCELPPENDDMHEVVSNVQMHSKKHSKSCKKKRTTCRFNFPRPPSNKTFICKPKTEEQQQQDKTNIEQQQSNVKTCDAEAKAKEIMSKVKLALSNEETTFDSVDALFSSIGINQSIFEKAYQLTTKKTSVIHKRNVNDVWVNQYNKDLLRCWNANLDIQFVCDPYSCVVYIISYISKAEREMGLLLQHTQNEVKSKGNLDAKQSLNKLGSVFLHNREVSAQESAYRLTNMRLKECSRKVVFVPTGDNIVRMSLPLNVIQKRAEQQDTNKDQIWMTNITDRYKNRPKSNEFKDMCLATYASQYRDVPKNEKCRSNVIKLDNDCGFVKKRTWTDVAVVRYARFSPTQHPEKHYQSLLQLFLPYYTGNQLKPPQFLSFEQFYDTASVTNGNEIKSVKEVVDLNRSKFEINAEELEHCEEAVAHVGFQEDAWAELCPEAELGRLESLEEMSVKKDLFPTERDVIPDLQPDKTPVSIEFPKPKIHHSEAQAIMRSLNDLQSQVFYKIRQWCLDKINGKNPAPFHVFISGGAGTGKSHLIKAVYYEATRLLARMSDYPDDVHVLLTAPTGVAAYNINATTIHHSFAICNNVSLPYQPLKEEKVNTVRASLKDLQILIIDEISMVDHKLLTYIHGRLRQIKQCADFSPFGNVSVIAVGDFYQLPPVKGRPLYTDQTETNLWGNTFSHVELTEIVRQKNKNFAVTLNRIRKHKKGEKLNVQDEKLLKRCETGTGDDTEDLHVFATNSDVETHNFKMLHKVCSDIVQIKAQDFDKNPQTGRFAKTTTSHTFDKQTYLTKLLSVGPNARVMLIKNIDTSDGLVNGVCGTVCLVKSDENTKLPKTIYVNFDDERIGSKLRAKFPCTVPGLQNATPIGREEDKVTNRGGVRRQFPLRLAWACTIHKVQGLTLDKAVVSFKKIFSAGQAYVALSRVTSIENLIIQDFKATAIYAKSDIDENLEAMEKYIETPLTRPDASLKAEVGVVNGKLIQLYSGNLGI